LAAPARRGSAVSAARRARLRRCLCGRCDRLRGDADPCARGGAHASSCSAASCRSALVSTETKRERRRTPVRRLPRIEGFTVVSPRARVHTKPRRGYRADASTDEPTTVADRLASPARLSIVPIARRPARTRPLTPAAQPASRAALRHALPGTALGWGRAAPSGEGARGATRSSDRRIDRWESAQGRAVPRRGPA